MLIDFSVTNFLSFKSKQTFSMIKLAGKELEKTNVLTVEGYKKPLLRSSVIYGANASGKSNLFFAFVFLKKMVYESTKWQRGDKIPRIVPFLLDRDSKKEPTKFEINFIVEGVRYQYIISVTPERVFGEWLFAFPKGQAQRWIDRVWDEETQEYDWGDCRYFLASTKQKKIWQDSTRSNALFLSIAVQLNCEQLQPVFDWFAERLFFVGNEISDTVTGKMCLSKEGLKAVLEFLIAADLGIHDLVVETKKFSTNPQFSKLPDELKQGFLEMEKDGKMEYLSIEVAHKTLEGDVVYFPLGVESQGTQKLFALASRWLTILENGGVVFVDELSNNLHPNLLKFLISLFHNPKTNQYGAQLIFNSHYSGLLKNNLFRRDQIWFVEKNRRGESHLIQLKDFKVIKDRENIEANYMAGKYGGLPFIDYDFSLAE